MLSKNCRPNGPRPKTSMTVWINDSDLIGTHARYGYVVPLSDFMAGEGKDVTLPTLDVDDFMGKSFTTGPGRANCTSFRISSLPIFTGSVTTGSAERISKRNSRRSTGMNWGCRSTGRLMRILPNFSPSMFREIDGKAIFGHNDYGKKAPDLGWRFTDAWLVHGRCR